MTRSPRAQRLYFLATGLALLPFAFGFIRAVTTGTDFRYLWMALAAFLGVAGVLALGKLREGHPSATLECAAAFVAATLLTAAMGYLLGAKSAVSVGIVAVAFALCEAAAGALSARR